MLYWLLTQIFGTTLDLFYRRRHLEGEVPKTGAALLVANHPNGLVDPIMVVRIADRPVRSLAKAPLFKAPVISWLVKGIKALPVYRRQDGYTGEDNDKTFEAVFQAFEQGELICIFPEGTSHSEPELRPLKTGAARMALKAKVPVIPIGLLYRDKGTFRSEAATLVGAPIEPIEGEEVRALTERIDAGIRGVTINLQRWEDLPLLTFAEQLWRPDDKDALARIGVLADGERVLSERAPERLAALRARTERFAAELELFGLTPARLSGDYAPQRVLRFVLRNLVALVIGLPCALLGTLAYAPPFYLIRAIVSLMKPEEDRTATIKMLGGLLFYPLWHMAIVAWALWGYGLLFAITLSVGLPFAGLYALHFVRRRQAALREISMFFKVGRRGALVESLRAERDAIAAELDALEALYKEAQ